jgi:hypothetical protein
MVLLITQYVYYKQKIQVVQRFYICSIKSIYASFRLLYECCI